MFETWMVVILLAVGFFFGAVTWDLIKKNRASHPWEEDEGAMRPDAWVAGAGVQVAEPEPEPAAPITQATVASDLYQLRLETLDLIGLVIKSLGFSFTQHRLTYHLRDAKGHFITIIDPRWTTEVVLTVLGYDARLWEAERLRNREELFAFIVSSPLFKASAVQQDKWNRQYRQRDAARGTYSAFLQWLADNGHMVSQNSVDFTPASFYEYVSNDYPAFLQEVGVAQRRHHTARLRAAKLNGEIVHEVLGCTGRDIGIVLKEIEERFSDAEIAAASEEQIKGWIIDAAPDAPKDTTDAAE